MNKAIKIVAVSVILLTLVGAATLGFSANQSRASVIYSDNQSQTIQTTPVAVSSNDIAAGTLSTSISPASSLDAQWGLTALDIPQLWKYSTGVSGVIVAVLDSGIDLTHPNLVGQVIDSINLTASDTASDLLGHGTAVASIIAGLNNGTGMIGVAPDCSLLNVKVVDDRGVCDPANLARGIIWATDRGADVINISIQITTYSAQLEQAVAYALSHGVMVVAASGNNLPGQTVYPAAFDSVITVSAVTQKMELAPLADYGSWVDFVAPGYQIYSASPGGIFSERTGTSFAAPYISGISAVLFSILSDKNGDGKITDEVRDLLFKATSTISLYGIETKWIDMELLVSAL